MSNTSKDGSIKRIAVFANGWSTEYISLMLEGICREAAIDKADVFVFTSFVLWGEDERHKHSKLNLFRFPDPADYDGAILFANTFNSPDEAQTILERFAGSGVPMISTEVKIPGVAYVGTLNYKGMYDLVRHLIDEHDVKSVVYLSGIPGNEECAERRRALEDALAENGLKITDTIEGNFEFYKTSNEIDTWVEEGRPIPDAFVCANDHMALGVIYSLHQHGIDCPRDVIVTGFDHVREAQTSYPIIATVSRQWSRMGENVYQDLKSLINNPDPSFEKTYDTEFIPSESCGCEAREADKNKRLERVRNIYGDSAQSDMVEFIFQEIRVATSTVETKEEFNRVAGETMGLKDYLGRDYCICTEPDFFEIEDGEYVPKQDGYSERLDVLFERKDMEALPFRPFDTSEIYPGYVKDPDRSDLFVISPLTNLDYSIGYVAVKNWPDVLKDLCFKKWINNLDTLFVNIRQYIFSQRNNRKLREIYMTDFLTNMYNRTGCENVVFSHIESEKAAGRSTMFLFVDINSMKLINDRYGHLNGDLAIKATSNAMRKAFGDDWLFGRYGGDEFVAVGAYRPDTTIEDYRKRFNLELGMIVTRLQISFRLSASVGFCVIEPGSDRSIADYIKAADDSMYEQKEIAHREGV